LARVSTKDVENAKARAAIALEMDANTKMANRRLIMLFGTTEDRAQMLKDVKADLIPPPTTAIDEDVLGRLSTMMCDAQPLCSCKRELCSCNQNFTCSTRNQEGRLLFYMRHVLGST
jgi:hypothetical protein